jgi:hypothetical protein
MTTVASTISASSSAAMGLGMPIEQLLRASTFGDAKAWLPALLVIVVLLFMLPLRR